MRKIDKKTGYAENGDKCGGFQCEWTSLRVPLLLIINALHLPVLFFNLAFEYGLGVSKFIKLHRLFTADKAYLLINSIWLCEEGEWDYVVMWFLISR